MSISVVATKATAFDKHGRPIFPGDLLQSFHFKDRFTERKMYLHHVACTRSGGCLELVPSCYLDEKTTRCGGSYWLLRGDHPELEIIGENAQYADERDSMRRKMRKAKTAT